MDLKNFLITLIVTLIITVCFITGLVAFQFDIANFFGVATGSEPKLSLLKDLFLPFFAALGGAGGGAWVAFRLQESRDKKSALLKNVSLLNHTSYLLILQYSEILMIKKQGMLPYNDDPLRFLSIRSMGNDEAQSEKINMEMAQVLIDLNSPNLALEIAIAEKKYFNIMSMLKKRNALRQLIDERMEENGVMPGGQYFLGFLWKYVGPKYLAEIYDVTEGLIGLIDDALNHIPIQLHGIQLEAKKIVDMLEGHNNVIDLKINKENIEVLEPFAEPYFETQEKFIRKALSDFQKISQME